MDCVDRHNRPTHIYVAPRPVRGSGLLAAHRLDISLPFIKQQAVTVLTANYATTDAALQGIAKGIDDFYESKYPYVAKASSSQIRNAVTELQQIFQHTQFPEMKVNWQTHPNNLGITTSMAASAAMTDNM